MEKPKHPEELNADSWDGCDNIWVLTDFWTSPELRPHLADERKVRLLLLAACDGVAASISDPRSRTAIDAAEGCIDVVGFPIPDHIVSAAEQATLEAHAVAKQRGRDVTLWRAARAAYAIATPSLLEDDLPMPLWVKAFVDLVALDVPTHRPPDAHPRLYLLFHDLFPNPFRPVAFDPSWRTVAVTALADPIYAGRGWDRMPVLADSLEEAGCSDVRVLDHCRHHPIHARGCWVVDAVLGKS